MQAISKVEGKVSCIPNNTEKYISFSLGQLRFIDSAQFLLASLDKLVGSTVGLGGKCACGRALEGAITDDWLLEGMCTCGAPFFKALNPEPLETTRRYTPFNAHLLARKGIYPYEFGSGRHHSEPGCSIE